MGGGKRSGKRDDKAKVDESVPFAFLLGERYSGYTQAINSSKDLKPMPSKLPKLFWGLSNEQRRLLAARMLEAGHSGAELERAIRLALWGEGSSRRSIRVPSRLQPWDNAHNIEGGLNGVGLDGRPIVPERFRPREPFLAVEAEEVHTFGAGGRVEKPHERADCAPARRRREIQEMMRARVQVQEDFLAGLEVDRREWRRYRTHAAKSGVVESQHRKRQLRLTYGSDPSDGVASDITSFVPEFDDARREKQEVARLLKVARQAELKANAESATMRRWEKEVLKTIRADAANALRTPGTSIGGREPELTRALHQLTAEHGCVGDSTATHPTTGKRLEAREGDEEAGPTAAQERGGQVAKDADLPSTRAREGSSDGRDRPAAADGGARAALEQRGSAPGRSGETGANEEKAAAAAAGGGGGGATEAGTGCADVAAVSDMSEEENQAGEEKQQQGDGAIKSMVEKVLRTSSSVALAVARPLSIKPPPVLEVEQDPIQVKLASQIRSRKQKRSSPAQRASFERTFVGGGYRTNNGGGRGRGGGSGSGSGSGRSAEAKAPSNPDGGGGVAFAGSNPAATRSSSCPALATASAGILDLDAVTAAAGRLNGSGGGSGESGAHPESLAHHHPRNRFAPMAESEVERFLLQSWKNDYVVAGIGDEDSGGNSASGWGGSIGGGSIGCDVGKTPVASLLTGDSSSSANGQLHVARTSTRPKKGGRARGVAPRSPRAPTLLEGWTTKHAPTTETER